MELTRRETIQKWMETISTIQLHELLMTCFYFLVHAFALSFLKPAQTCQVQNDTLPRQT